MKYPLGLTLPVVVLVAAACGSQSPTPVSGTMSVLDVLGGDEISLEGYDRALAPRPFVFPRDHSAHPEFRSEWWYLTGVLRAEQAGDPRTGTPEDGALGRVIAGGEQGRLFGYQLTFFRTSMAPQPRGGSSAWGTTQAWMAHLTVSDVGAQRFVAAERFSRGGPLGLAGNRGAPFRVWLDDWSIHGQEQERSARDAAAPMVEGLPDPKLESDAQSSQRGDAPFLPVRVRAAHEMPDGERISIDLRLDSSAAPVLHGDRGHSRKGDQPGNASYYYSMPRIITGGVLEIAGESHAVAGASWLDREWSSGTLEPGLAGWDWFGLRLDDGRDLMIYLLRLQDGGVHSASGGTLVQADGRSVRLTADDIRVEQTAAWTSPSGVRYPSAWNVDVLLPGEDLRGLEIRPLIADQELRLAFRYWEGIVQVLQIRQLGQVSRDDNFVGTGYVELTGY